MKSVKSVSITSEFNDDWIRNIEGYDDDELTKSALATKPRLRGILRITKGGPGSGFHGHSGRPGSVGGSSSITYDIAKNDFENGVMNALSNTNYDEFSQAADKAGYVRDLVISVKTALNLKASINFMDDKTFNTSVSEAAAKAKVSPQMVKAYYRPKMDGVYVRNSLVTRDTTQNGFSEVLRTIYHELGHAYDSEKRKTKMVGVRSQDEYDNDKSEEYANQFSAGLMMLSRYARGHRQKIAIGPLLHHINNGGSVTDWFGGQHDIYR